MFFYYMYIFLLFIIWKFLAIKWAGKALIFILHSRDEMARTLAGIFLIRCGNDSLSLLKQEEKSSTNPTLISTIISSINQNSHISSE